VTSRKLGYQKYIFIYYHKWPGFCWVRYFLSINLWNLYCSYTKILFWSATIYSIFSRSNLLHTSWNLSWWFSSFEKREIEGNIVTATENRVVSKPWYKTIFTLHRANRLIYKTYFGFLHRKSWKYSQKKHISFSRWSSIGSKRKKNRPV